MKYKLYVNFQYKLEATPPPSDEEEESSDEEDGFGPKKEKVDEDPVARKKPDKLKYIDDDLFAEAKAMAEKAMSDPMAVAGNLKFW